jgi:hypothetical protein
MFLQKRDLAFSCIGAFSLLILLTGCIPETESQTESRAGLIIQHENGEWQSYCLTFTGDEINGEELLDLSGIPYLSDAGNPMGSIICMIEREGCDFPAEKCLCQCSNQRQCSYWAYFVLHENEVWIYSPFGASLRKVHDGDVDAWVWLNRVNRDQDAPTTSLPEVGFEDICK